MRKKNVYSAVFAVQTIALNPRAEKLYIVVGDYRWQNFEHENYSVDWKLTKTHGKWEECYFCLIIAVKKSI